ncbi:MAG: bifunctional demethylmenaquinone methyltransferase/2-methoxy-6-polyprenyl-1,4-benzoquinol methylase UbiE [Armatimonadota bacterium]
MRGKLVGKEKERYINRLFGSIASKYDLMNSVISLGMHKSWRKIAVRMAGIEPGASAIDVATGTGDFAKVLSAAAGYSGLVVGTDFCRPMIAMAANKLASERNIELVTANAEHLPFASGTFDCATIGFALRNVANVQAAVAEMTRVIKPGGRVISLEILGPDSRILQPLWRLYFFRIMPRLAGLFGAEREPYDYLPNSVARFCSREELADIFKSCGLVDIHIRNLTFGTVCIHMGTKNER